jgi:uncharacterized protein YlxW (UPF0749 family)
MWKLRIAAVTAFAIFAAGSAMYAYNSGKQSGMSTIQTRWDADRLATLQAQTAELEKARQAEQALQAQVDKIQQESANEKRRIAAQYERTIAGLRERPERPSAASVPTDTGVGVGCTGAGLARPDATFLAGYAADAARLQSALQACIADRAAIERQLNGAAR